MVQSNAKTVEEYLNELPSDRAEAIQKVRSIILKNLPKGYEEIMDGMIVYVVPLSIYPKGYLDKKDVPLPYAGLASQKNHMAVYLMNIYGSKEHEQWFREEYKKSGKKLDMGKSCVRFKKLDDLPLDLIGEAIALTPMEQLIDYYENARPIQKARKRKRTT